MVSVGLMHKINVASVEEEICLGLTRSSQLMAMETLSPVVFTVTQTASTPTILITTVETMIPLLMLRKCAGKSKIQDQHSQKVACTSSFQGPSCGNAMTMKSPSLR